jgi:hypothetical protein
VELHGSESEEPLAGQKQALIETSILCHWIRR